MGYLGLGGSGDYAMETVVAFDSTQEQPNSLNKQIVAVVNDTDFYTGFFGLGMQSFSFHSGVAQSPIAALADRDGTIGGHSYGYTAGAYYVGTSGTPLSLTLGGYDENRFEHHDISFRLNSTTYHPEVQIKSITASVANLDEAPTSWQWTSFALSSVDESVTAVIDSSTPFLWLPSSICDRFADAFNLTWNEALGLYLFDDYNLGRFRSSQDLSVNFTLASIDNANDSSEPHDQRDVNITISANAFIQTLRYPSMKAMSYRAPPVHYFPLRRVNDGGKIIIGRTFMQEAYLITDYDMRTFSVHQARFPDDPLRNTSIKATPSGNRPHAPHKEHNGLTRDAVAGIVVGASVLGMAIIMMVWWMLRKKKVQGRGDGQPEPPRTQATGLLLRGPKTFPWLKFRIGNPRDQFSPSPYSSKGYDTPSPQPLPAVQYGPKHLRSNGAEFGPEDIMAYEIARMGLGPLPPDLEYDLSSPSMQDHVNGNRAVDPTAYHRPFPGHIGPDARFTASQSPDDYSDGSTSPMTPYGDLRGEWAHNMSQFPSSQPLVPPQPRARPEHTLAPSDPNPNYTLRSAPSHGSLMHPSTPIQRRPIDSDNVICLGPLPPNIRLPYQTYPSSMPPPAEPWGVDLIDPPTIPSLDRQHRASTTDTLGSNYTVDEEGRWRIHGSDIVHIPQPPERRYSWEDS
ncbi:hypothetical protein DL766_010368 [Monosporascus sp. MC13-8B]|uniref:Peptidase A1 domain-containing protein n=1 Tax=Monosporascus cannonballus TaxID=155416 RepID=A0ABY0GR02_9PEZI|nr:hypothetical protein DL762_010661 [Monosporascus cannonballus]RYO81059.1 hypothetical protein DL763_008698 [Monosporascus cannonballus]RYP02392.1 hypothetical protein DL766_010368 [Monosporascus sp. MC13-8B]